ncbi:MAG: Hsp20/alpha crystallin family protein [Methylacidiphilales bacterium]|nr:Hsp20/alpha crystallin family protein [Candidatus Methylacidiphilales bacterium]
MTRSMLPSVFGRGDEGFGSLFREVERVFDDFARRAPFTGTLTNGLNTLLMPRVDIAETAGAIDVTAELPGVSEKDVEVSVAHGVLTIRGEKKIERDEKGKDWQVIERSHGSFHRSIQLGFDPDPAKVEAKFEKGVLTIHLPKPAEDVSMPKKIAIKSLG